MAHIKHNNKITIIKNKINGFSLVEVLISLAIISSTILIILTAVAKATRQATYNKLKMEMVSSATGILSKTQDILYTQYKDSNWDTILIGNIQLSTDINGNNIIQHTSSSCIPTQNPLNDSCPTVTNILNNVDYIAYVIHAEQQGTSNVYKLTITTACKANTKCNPTRLAPVKMDMYIVKY